MPHDPSWHSLPMLFSHRLPPTNSYSSSNRAAPLRSFVSFRARRSEQLLTMRSLLVTLLSRPPRQAQYYEHHAFTHWGLGRVLHTVFEHSFSRLASTREQLAADSIDHPSFSFFRSPHLSTNSNHFQKCTPISRRIVLFNRSLSAVARRLAVTAIAAVGSRPTAVPL